MASCISENPGPDVAVNGQLSRQGSPIHAQMDPISSSICRNTRHLGNSTAMASMISELGVMDIRRRTGRRVEDEGSATEMPWAAKRAQPADRPGWLSWWGGRRAGAGGAGGSGGGCGCYRGRGCGVVGAAVVGGRAELVVPPQGSWKPRGCRARGARCTAREKRHGQEQKGRQRERKGDYRDPLCVPHLDHDPIDPPLHGSRYRRRATISPGCRYIQGRRLPAATCRVSQSVSQTAPDPILERFFAQVLRSLPVLHSN